MNPLAHDTIRQQVRAAHGAAARAGGAAGVDELAAQLAVAGFADIRIAPKAAGGEYIRNWAPGRGVERHNASAAIEAVKPLEKTS